MSTLGEEFRDARDAGRAENCGNGHPEEDVEEEEEEEEEVGV